MYKVIKTFKDKYTGELYKKGDKVPFEDERAAEILKVDNFIEKIAEKPVKKEPEAPKKEAENGAKKAPKKAKKS